MTRNALAARNNKAYGQGKTADSGSVQSFATIKNTGHGNFAIGRFHTRARNGLSVRRRENKNEEEEEEEEEGKQ